MHGMTIWRVKAFLAFSFNDIRYRTALVKWFVSVDDQPDPVTWMWIVKPEATCGQYDICLVHVDCIVRACHLIGVYGRQFMPIDFHFSHALDAFHVYYVNYYIDYHAYETIP